MAPDTIQSKAELDSHESASGISSFEIERRYENVRSNFDRWWSVMEKTGFSRHSGSQATRDWINRTERTKIGTLMDDGILSREDFFRKQLDVMEHGVSLHQEFMGRLSDASRYISSESKQRWLQRYYDEKPSFQAKKYWIQQQFPHYVTRWKETYEERERLVADPAFRQLGPKDIDVSKIRDKNAFLNLHYNDRAGLLAKARAAILAQKGGKSELFTSAKSLLNMAASKKVMSASHVGIWLERIFKSGADRTKIEKFLSGSGSTDLRGLIANWADVKGKYDRIVDKVKRRGSNRAHGLYIPTESQFLNMHYAQRLACVQKLEDQLGGANDIHKDPAAFLEIRHALDLRDWEDADEKIRKTEKLDLSPDQRTKLQSMKRYLTQFRTDVREKSGAGAKKVPGEAAKEAKNKIDSLIEQLPSQLKPTVLRLLRGPNANRNIHQLRWIVYNNKWCRDHNYLNRNKARRGASRLNRDLTQQRGDSGEDIGMHDVQDNVTAGKKYIRKDNKANHKPTLRHVDMQSSGAMRGLEEWLEHEQNSRVLYWTTFCGHENGEPMSENWHNDLFFNLNELRSATRTLNKAGFSYDGPGKALIGKN